MKTEIKINSTLEPKLEELVDNLIAKKKSKNPFQLKEAIGIVFGLVGFVIGLWQWTDKSYEVKKAEARIALLKVDEKLQKIEMNASISALTQSKLKLTEQIDGSKKDLKEAERLFTLVDELNKTIVSEVRIGVKAATTARNSLREATKKEEETEKDIKDLKTREINLEKKISLRTEELKRLKDKLGAVLTYALEDEDLSNYAILRLLSVKVISQDRGCFFCINKKNVSVFVDYPNQYNEQLSQYFDVEPKRIQDVRYVNLISQYDNKPPSSINFKGGPLNQLFKDPNGIRYVSSYLGNDAPTALTAQVKLSASRKTTDKESQNSAEYEKGGCFEIYYSIERNEQKVFPSCRT